MTGGPAPEGLAADRRWQRLTSRDYVCPCCGTRMSGIYDLGYDHPDAWPHGNRAASGEDMLVVGEDRLGTDLCTFDGYYFVRCVLPLPIRGSDAVFAFGPWASLSEHSFNRYLEAGRADSWDAFPRCFGWLMNALPTFEIDTALPCNVEMGDGSQRPELHVKARKHPLAQMQRDGISFDRLLDIYAAAGNDLRPHLGDA